MIIDISILLLINIYYFLIAYNSNIINKKIYYIHIKYKSILLLINIY